MDIKNVSCGPSHGIRYPLNVYIFFSSAKLYVPLIEYTKILSLLSSQSSIFSNFMNVFLTGQSLERNRKQSLKVHGFFRLCFSECFGGAFSSGLKC